MERIINVLSNIDSNFDRLTDYVLSTYIKDARFTSNIWYHCDLIGRRSGTNDYLEG